MLKSIQNTTKDSINNLLHSDELQEGSALKDLHANIDQGALDFIEKMTCGNLTFESFTETTDVCKLNSNQRKILTDTIAAFNKGLANNQTAAYGGHSYEDAKKKAIHITNVYLTKAVNSGLFDQIVGDKKDCFISELERSLNIPVSATNLTK